MWNGLPGPRRLERFRSNNTHTGSLLTNDSKHNTHNVQSGTKVSGQLVEIDINNVSLNMVCLHRNVNINFNDSLNSLNR